MLALRRREQLVHRPLGLGPLGSIDSREGTIDICGVEPVHYVLWIASNVAGAVVVAVVVAIVVAASIAIVIAASIALVVVAALTGPVETSFLNVGP